MPFTPFHFGPGLLVKAIAPRAFSLATFVATQVVIDLESVYHLVRQNWPVHRQLHSLFGATIVGLAVGLAAWVAGAALRGRFRAAPPAHAEVSLVGTISGGVVGGISHSILDGMMHGDVRPYWPLSDAPGWGGIVSVGSLHLACVLTGVLGGIILWLSWRRRLAV
jgi:hypothetical protein